MPETWGMPEPEQSLEERAEPILREAITGHPQGAVRRILLWVAAFALVVSPFPVLAVVPMALLALTDQLA